MGITTQLAEYALSIRFEQLPNEVVEKAKQCVLDLLGIAIRAQHDAESSPPVEAAVAELSRGAQGAATAVGHKELYPAHFAALLNGTYAHTLDFDDTHARGSLHPGAPTIPAALAVAEEVGADGATLIAAIVSAYEVACRLAMAVTPQSHYDRGFHPTATCGTFGAAAAAAQVWHFSPGELESAFGLCGSMAAGSLQFLDSGGWNKRVHVGMAAHNGIVAAVFARKGVRGARQALEGRLGFLKGYTDEPHPERIIEAMGERWAILETALKPYPACRFTHSAIDSILDLVQAEHLRPEEIEGIRIGLPRKGLDLVALPTDRKKTPENVVDGQFSMYWTAAVAAVAGRLTWAEYALLRDERVLDLARRIEVVHDSRAEAHYPDHFPSVVTIRARGRDYERLAADPRGEPGRDLTWTEIERKFHGLVEGTFASDRLAEIVANVRQLDRVADIRELTRLLRP